MLEYAPGGNHEHGEGPHRGGVQGLLKREQSNGAQHGLSDPPPPPETTTHTHPDRSDLPGKNGGDCFAPAAQGLTLGVLGTCPGLVQALSGPGTASTGLARISSLEFALATILG